jgi:hypothetical protein
MKEEQLTDTRAEIVESRIRGLFYDLADEKAASEAELAMIQAWNDFLADDQGLYGLITSYYNNRGLKWPADADEALDWLLTELAEAKELLLARRGDWVRNNPDAHPDFNRRLLKAEIADILMMALVAGMVEGLDPLAALHQKLRSIYQ